MGEAEAGRGRNRLRQINRAATGMCDMVAMLDSAPVPCRFRADAISASRMSVTHSGERQMFDERNVAVSYKSILVSIDIDDPSTALIKLAADLARRFDARLIGCSSADLVPPMVTIEGMVVDTGMIERQRLDIEARLEQLEEKFTELSGPGLALEWRSDLTAPSRMAIRLARMADLVVTGSPEGAKASDAFRALDLGDLLMHAGRPVLIAAANAEHLLARKALVAWKDTSEARRAVADAVPLLVDADEVVVATVAMDASVSEHQSLADVTAYLKQHGVKARSEILVEKHDTAALVEFAATMHADLVVAGAYGHSRLRELIFGGVTRSLFDETGLNRLMSA